MALSGTGGDSVTPELVLVDPALAKNERQIQERTRKAAMSSTEPSNGTFFVDPAQPPPATMTPEPSPLPPPTPAVEATLPAGPDSGSSSMLDVPLGTLIFRAGLLAEEQLEDALQEGMRTGKRLGEVLLERGWLHERDLGRLLAGQKGLPFVEVSASDSDPAARQVILEEKARLQVALPLRYEEGQLVVAVADPSNELVLENLRRTLGTEPRLVVAAYTDLLRAIGEAYGSPSGQPAVAAPPDSLASEPTFEPAMDPTPAPAPAPEPAPFLQTEPEPVQPVAAPVPAVPTPLATVVPPAQERAAEPAEVPALQPLVAQVEAPAAEEAPMIAPPALPIEEAPAPLLEPPAVEADAPATVEPAAPSFVQQTEPPLEATTPAAPVEQVDAVAAQPVPEVIHEPAVVTPGLVEQPAFEQPAPVPAEPLLQQPVMPSVTEPLVPAVANEPMQDSMGMHAVLLRLRDGDVVEVGGFPTAAEASARAQEVVAQIASADGAATWPFFAERYLRPDMIVSVDLVEQTPDKWMGSSARRSWANNG